MEALRWTADGTALFLHTLSGLTDDRLDEPSLLPGWSRRHLLAHVALNAEALTNLVTWARTGVETPMYASPLQRNADIESGATRSPSALREWVPRAAARLDEALSSLTPEQWRHRVRTAQGRDRAAAEIPWMRAREVLIHAVDLDAGVTFADLPRDFLAALVGEIAAQRPGPALLLRPTDDPRTWTMGTDDDPAAVRGPLPQLAAYLAGRPFRDVTPAPGLPPWL